MDELSWADVDALVSALRDPASEVRLAALRALVRLPVSRDVWFEAAHFVSFLLESDPEGQVFAEQTLDGIPYQQVIDAAVFIPVRRVREMLYQRLQSPERDVRLAAVKALARAQDPESVFPLMEALAETGGESRIGLAELLAGLDVSAASSEVSDLFRKEQDPDMRLWLAIALAQTGDHHALAIVLRDLDEGRLDLRSNWGDPVVFSEKLMACGPLPEPVRDWLIRATDQELRTEYARQVAMDLYHGGQIPEMPAEQAPAMSPAPDPELEKQAEELIRTYLTKGQFEIQRDPRLSESELIPYIPPDRASDLVIALFWHVYKHGEADGVGFGNSIVEGIFAARGTFKPDLAGLFKLYQALFQDTGDEMQGAMFGPLRWQVAWTVSRAGLPDMLVELTPYLEAESAGERALAAELIEVASLYRNQAYPPLFGGGSDPAGGPPKITEFLEEELEMANGGSREDDRSGEPFDLGDLGGADAGTRGGISFEIPDDPGADEGGPVRGLEPSEIDDRSDGPRPGRVVNTGFATQSQPDVEIEPEIPLRAGADYFFWLDIGRPHARSIEATPVDIPDVPAETELTVALFGFEDGLVTTPGADVGTLFVRRDGSVRVVRQPLGALAPQSKHYDRRLLFPVGMPDKSGSYRMRCNIYWGQVLLQSRIIEASVRVQPRPIRRGEPALRSTLDYTLARDLNPAHLNQLAEHRLSVMLNANEDGSHSLHLLGSTGQDLFKNDDIRFQGGELHGMINQARQTLRIASWETPDEWNDALTYRYKDRQLKLDRLKDDLINLAGWGYEFYTLIRSRLAGGEIDIKAFEALLLEPCSVQIAMKESPSYVLPAAMIYDYPLDVGAPALELCPNFVAGLEAQQALGDLDCFRGLCPTRQDLGVVCPSGFWGFRHFLGMPLSVKDAPDVPTEITFAEALNMSVGVATDMQFLQPHEQALLDLHDDLQWSYADTRAEVFTALKSAPHIVYFYCHGGLARGAPYLQVGPSDRPELISRSNLYAYEIVWETPRPLVFINGCHTTALDPLQALEFISPLVTYSHCAGVIGTEITIFEELATVFAEECFRRFFQGETIAEAIRAARLKLLATGNPLGLVYIPFVIAGLKLVHRQR